MPKIPQPFDRPPLASAGPRARLTALACGVALSALALSACGPTDTPATPKAAAPHPVTATVAAQPAPAAAQRVPAAIVADVAEAQPRARDRGRITVVEPIKQRPKSGATGGIVGGMVGAVVGNQVGSGSGRAAATVAGGVGGALLGNKIERMNSETVVGYRIHVQLDNGNTRVFERSQLNGLDVGDRVRINGNSLREI